MIKDIAFTGYPVSDMKRARGFYEGILGLVPSDEFGPVTEESQFIEYVIGTNTLSLGKMDEWKPSNDGPMITLEVKDFDEAVKKLKENNVPFVMEPILFPNCSMATVRDSEGNLLAIHHKKA